MSRMSDNANLEELIAESRAAHEAGVFSRTRLDVAGLVEPPRASLMVRFYERALVGLPLAACLGIAIGIAWMSGGPMDVSPSRSAVMDGASQPAVVAELCSLEVIAECAGGPGSAVGAECGCADLDSDGDVDLFDWSSYQRLAGGAR